MNDRLFFAVTNGFLSISSTANTLTYDDINDVSRDMRFPTICYVRPAKPQISLRISAVQSEPLLVA